MKGRTRREAAILIVGRVAGLREHLRWYDAKPLFGLKVLVTRAKEQAAELSDQLAALGAEPVEAPMIRILPPEDRTPLLRAAAQLDVFDWIVFTSANAVDSLMHAVLETGGDVRSLKGPQLCAIGSATAEQLAKYGIKVDLIPAEFKADAVVSALKTRGPLDAVRVLLPRADIGREVIAEQLREAGALVTDVVAYRNVLDDGQRRRRARHLPDAARRRDPGRHLHQRLGGPQLHQGARRRAGRGPAEEDHRGGHRAGHRGSGRPARHRGDGAADHLHGAGAGRRHRGARGRAQAPLRDRIDSSWPPPLPPG